MKLLKLNVTIFLLLIAFSANSQKFEIGIGSRFQETFGVYSKVGGASIFNVNSQKTYYPIGLHFNFPIGERFNSIVGVRYFEPGTSFLFYDDNPCSLCPIQKVALVYHPTLEVPLSLGFKVLHLKKFRLRIFGEITPSFRLKSTGSKYDGEVRPPGWTEDVINVYNHLPTTTKMFYFNYGGGVRLSYSRFSLSAYLQRNLNNLAKPMVINGHEYYMDRSVISLNLSLAFAFWHLKK